MRMIYSDQNFKGVSGAAANIVKYGGLVGIGAHHEVQGMGTPWELMLMSTGGMPLHDVLRVGSIFGAGTLFPNASEGSINMLTSRVAVKVRIVRTALHKLNFIFDA